MKFISGADLHIHSKTPENRKGDYYKQIMEKFEKLLEITTKYSDENLLVIAGDFFDSAKVKYEVTNKILKLLQKYKEVKVLAIPGQHDLHYHVNGLDNTPLGILSTCKSVTILNPVDKVEIAGTSFVGTGWNEEPKTEADVLVTHQMITKKGELWPGQTNYSSAHAILRKRSWAKCVLSGDNHAPHSLRIKDGEGGHRLQINSGSLVRSTKSQIDFEPRVYLVDTLDWKAKAIKIPCLPAEEVFDFNKITINEMKEESKKEAEKKIAEFISTLPKNDKERPDFKTILSNVVEHADPKQTVKNIINETMERISK